MRALGRRAEAFPADMADVEDAEGLIAAVVRNGYVTGQSILIDRRMHPS